MLPSVASSVANVPVSVSDVPVDVEVLPPTLAGIVADVPVAVEVPPQTVTRRLADVLLEVEVLPSVASSVANVPVSVSDVLVEVEVLPPTLASSIYDWVDASVDGDDDSMMSIVIPNLSVFLTNDKQHTSDKSSLPAAGSDIMINEASTNVSSTEGHILISCRSSTKNRKLPCYYCNKFMFHMSRHLVRKHNEEPLVAAATANLVRKNECLRNIANQGIYKHNIEVLRQNDGILMVARAPATRRTAADFLPCEFCLQFFVKRELYRHCTECKFRMPDAPIDGFVASGRNLLDGSINGNSNIGAELAEQVISRMRIDKVTSIVKTDTLILQLGEQWRRNVSPWDGSSRPTFKSGTARNAFCRPTFGHRLLHL